MLLVSSCSCLYRIRWSQALSWEWRWRCSNYIWVINNLVANWSASYIRDSTVITIVTDSIFLNVANLWFPFCWHKPWKNMVILQLINGVRRFLPEKSGVFHNHNRWPSFWFLTLKQLALLPNKCTEKYNYMAFHENFRCMIILFWKNICVHLLFK